MRVRLRLALSMVILASVAACKDGPTAPKGPFDTPLPASLKVGDLVRVNVNGEQGCTNAIIRAARVVAIGGKSMILADTLNPAGGFTTADYQRFAAKFDTLVYPVDEGAFGAPTDIDNNGRVGIIFTTAVNQLTPAGSTSYVGGFTFSRDLFPRVATSRAQACATSNQGEYFYSLAPDPQGTINGNRRTAGFVDSVTVPVLAHELEHLINASRKLYINTTAEDFEDKWLDEGLAHIAEELLFYREGGVSPRTNIDVTALRERTAIVRAFNANMLGNAGRYRSYLAATPTSSPYANGDSLTTRGATWNWLRYLADQKLSGIVRAPDAATELSGAGTVSVDGGATGTEYYATLVNSSTTQDLKISYGITATSVIPPVATRLPIGGPSLNRATALGASELPLQRDAAFEARLRSEERAIALPRMAAARDWYRSEINHEEVPQGGRFSVSAAPIASPDGDIWFRLVNNTVVGIANLQQVFGVDASVAVSDWSASHAVDDISGLVRDQFRQPSWNWHSIYSALGTSGAYPLPVTTMIAGTPYAGELTAGGSTHFRFAVPATATATLTVTSGSAVTPGLRLLVIRTK